MTEYIVTFGVKYRHETHPKLGDVPTLPNGYGVIEADDYAHACRLAHDVLGVYYCMVYLPGEAGLHHYPLGVLLRITEHQGAGRVEFLDPVR